MQLVHRSALTVLTLFAAIITTTLADEQTLYEKKGSWIETMHAARAAVARARAESPAFRSDTISGERPAQAISVDVSSWDQLWLITDGAGSQGIWCEPRLIDTDGVATPLGRLRWKHARTDEKRGRVYKNGNPKKQPLKVDREEFAQGLWVQGTSEIEYQLDGKKQYVRFEAKVGVDAAKPKGATRFIVAPQGPPERELWARIAEDFPQETGWIEEDSRGRFLPWFGVDDEQTTTIEQSIIRTNLGRCSAYGRPLNDRSTVLRKTNASNTDPAWLTLYVESRQLRASTAQIYDIGQSIKAMGDAGRELRERYDEMVDDLLAPADPRWGKFNDEVRRFEHAVATLKLFNPVALRRAIADLSTTYGDQYGDDRQLLARLDKIEARLAAGKISGQLAVEATRLSHDALLANPLMQFDKLLLRRATNPGLVNNWIHNCSRKKVDYGNEIMVLSPPRPDGELTTLIAPSQDSFIGDMDLHWDAQRMLVTALGTHDRWQIFEVGTDGRGMTQVTPGAEPDVDNAEGCYLPDGAILYGSTATMAGVPCVGGKVEVANLYRLEADRKTARQLTFEQDQDWCPTVLHNGRVLYLRWEYTDSAHYFTRVLMSMNPDGTNQMSYYGTNSFWPNSLFFARPVPNDPTKFVGVISGHHGVPRMGELILFDPARGRREADGVIQRIPGYGKPVEPIVRDGLVNSSWPKFLHPWPLSDKYFLVSAQLNSREPWGIYLVDVFDNMLLICQQPGTGMLEPIPLVPRTAPPVIVPRVDLEKDAAVMVLSDVHTGPGLADVPSGIVKRLRVFTYTYGYRGIGGHANFGMESSWDSKRILGTVPVNEDGSAVFRVPANTPLSIQPLDEDGRALQLMRSWTVAQRGEVLSCVGCHEDANSVPESRSTEAYTLKPSEIEPFYGPARAFSFHREIQPILDKYCVGCHDGTESSRPNFADIEPGPRNFSNSYHALHGYVRRPGPESDYHLLRPLEYHASTSELFQMLERGHHNVKLDRESWDKLYCWADFNVPYFGTWSEIGGERIAEVSDRYRELRLCYAGCDENPEADAVAQPDERPAFIKPEPEKPVAKPAANWPGWPFTPSEAAKRTITLADGATITLARIPAGGFVMGDPDGDAAERPLTAVSVDRPFWMATTEVTNSLYARYFPEHDSRYIDQQWKDHATPGYPANKPQQPVIRVSWNEAMEFCRRLSEETGLSFTLPTEAQWEWACRAGSDTPLWFGKLDDEFSAHANLADESLRRFVVKGVNPKAVAHEDWQAFIPRAHGLDDGLMITGDVGSYTANPWGLYDMHGNVTEWTLSDDRPYPYRADDGRNAGDPTARKIVRGGSWRDRPHRARSGFRLSYPAWQKVFNVGFRVVWNDTGEVAAVTAE